MRPLLLVLLSSAALAAPPPPFIQARALSFLSLRASVERGEPVAAWGGVQLTGGVAADAGAAALAALKHAARHVRSRTSLWVSPVEFLLRGAGVAAANISYSEDGVSLSRVTVAGAHPEGVAWEEVPVLGRIFWVTLAARVAGAGGEWAEHELVLCQGVPDGDLNVLSHTASGGAPPPPAEAAMAADGSTTVAPPQPLRVLSYNVCA